MGVCIYYRSCEPLHPAAAYDINQHVDRLLERYTWNSCEPVLLRHFPDGHLGGASKPNFDEDEFRFDEEMGGLPDGNVMTLVEVLCELSRDHEVDWDIGDDYSPKPIGCIRNGVADLDLMEQLETLDLIGDLLESETIALEEDDQVWSDEAIRDHELSCDDDNDEGPRLLKFPKPD